MTFNKFFGVKFKDQYHVLSVVSKVVTMVSVVGRYETYSKILRPKDLKPYRPARDTSTSESPEIKKISLTFKFCHNFAWSLFCYIFYQSIWLRLRKLLVYLTLCLTRLSGLNKLQSEIRKCDLNCRLSERRHAFKL